MSLQKVPIFKSGNILTHEMLDSLKNQTMNVEEMSYLGYSDGVLKGCNITTAQGALIVGKGIIIVKSKLYYNQNDVVLHIQPTNSMQVIVVRASEEEINLDFAVREVKIMVVAESNMMPGDIEICRFCLQAGAFLRSVYRDLRDMDTEYDTVCLKYAKWAAYEQSSISLAILRCFLQDARKFNNLTEEDKSFLSRIAATDGKTLNAEEINMYLSWKLQNEYKDRSTSEMYRDLVAVLRLLQGGKGSMTPRRLEPRKLIVD